MVALMDLNLLRAGGIVSHSCCHLALIVLAMWFLTSVLVVMARGTLGIDRISFAAKSAFSLPAMPE